MGIILFWVFMIVVAVGAIWAGQRNRLEMERTIRAAIEKGAVTDIEALERLRAEPGAAWRTRLVIFGVMGVSLAFGVAAFALFLRMEEPESFMPLLGISAFLAILGVGLALSGLLLRRLSAAPPR